MRAICQIIQEGHLLENDGIYASANTMEAKEAEATINRIAREADAYKAPGDRQPIPEGKVIAINVHEGDHAYWEPIEGEHQEDRIITKVAERWWNKMDEINIMEAAKMTITHPSKTDKIGVVTRRHLPVQRRCRGPTTRLEVLTWRQWKDGTAKIMTTLEELK